jgi:tryptophan synthase alpha chain
LARKRQKALIVFMTAGDPSLKKNGELIRAFEKEGVDLVELGVPFSDPLADGPVIQASSQRSLARGTNLAKILRLVKKVRRTSQLPLILMTYLNPVWHYGVARFAKDARRAGVDGVIVPDLPPDEGKEIAAVFHSQKLDLIYLLAPTSGAKRQKMVARRSRGFIYYVSLTGVTGVRRSLSRELSAQVRAVKKVSRISVCVGFGVSTPEQARQAAVAGDGVIIGSAVVRALARHRQWSAAGFARQVIRPFARALGKGSSD